MITISRIKPAPPPPIQIKLPNIGVNIDYLSFSIKPSSYMAFNRFHADMKILDFLGFINEGILDLLAKCDLSTVLPQNAKAMETRCHQYW
jgi:hypothetical protein